MLNEMPGAEVKKAKKAKKKQLWPRISKVIDHGIEYHRVDTRINGVGERPSFRTREEAESFAQGARAKRGNEGAAAFDDLELKRHGWSIQDAIKFALQHLRRQAASKPLGEAITAFVDFKKPDVGGLRISDIENRLEKFRLKFPERTIAMVTPEDIGDFLKEIAHPTTRNDYRKEIVGLWRFARAKKWVTELIDPVLVPVAAEPDKARVILTVDQAAALMAASTDREVRALNALVLFGGVRREEVEKLEWKDIDLKKRIIHISADVSKVARERFAPIHDNLAAWLEPLAQKSGFVISRRPDRKTGALQPRTLMHVLRDTWEAAGIVPWPQDAHRHSFISYRRVMVEPDQHDKTKTRIVGDSQTAQEAGTSEKIIKKHYKRPVTLADAIAFFKIAPPKIQPSPEAKR